MSDTRADNEHTQFRDSRGEVASSDTNRFLGASSVEMDGAQERTDSSLKRMAGKSAAHACSRGSDPAEGVSKTCGNILVELLYSRR